MKTVSVVIPAFNEEDCVRELTERLTRIFTSEYSYNWEAIIVDNGSKDQTWRILKEIANKDARFKILRLSRNFRMDGGLTAGLGFVGSDACVLMSADLQDPPEMIPKFLRKWEEGFENIYGIIGKRSGTKFVRKINSILFYKIAGSLTNNMIPENASDFRLVDRKVYEAVREMNERNRFVRGLFAWVGFKSIGVEAERAERYGGVSNAHSLVVIDLAFKGIFSHSSIPLKLITVTGVALSVASFLSLVGFSIFWLLAGVPFAGFGTIVSLVVLAFGVLNFMLGIIAEYLGLIYEEVKGRQNFIVSEMLGL